MRKIDLDPPATKTWQRWLAACDKATARVCAGVAEGKKPVITRLYRRKSIKKSYFLSKGPPFYGKCAYCEAPIADYQHGDVDHFRPKAAVTDEDDRPIVLFDEDGEVRLDAEGQPLPHPGYYWLAYDWQNLLPTCTKCNQPTAISGRKVGKHSRFPVEGRHAQQPDQVATEKPLLIHPASGRAEDDPGLHLMVDPRTGIMGHRTERGRTCIEIFALNVRDQLVADRKRACNEARLLVIRLLVSGDQEAARDIADIQAGRRTFTMAQRAVFREAAASIL